MTGWRNFGSDQQCNFVQVKYTNQNVLHVNQRGGRESMTFDLKPRGTQKARGQEKACLFLDQIKREKGVWWMPWQ
tara:strand:- start:172 stop:396 length:225 start_codon:yes stop_codon:yes gene_type:complete